MAFTINNSLVFIDSMQFMNSSLGGDLLELLKQKGVYPLGYIVTLKRFLKINYPREKNFLVP